MITKMKKLTFLVYHKEYEDFLKKLQEKGVLHVQPTQEGGVVPSSELEEKMRLTEHLAEVIERLAAFAPGATGTGTAQGAEAYLQQADEQAEVIRQATQGLQRLEKDEAVLQPWGDFDPEAVKRLKEVGYVMNFFTCGLKDFDPAWEEAYNATCIHQNKERCYFVTLTPVGEELNLAAEPVALPDTSLRTLYQKVDDLQFSLQQAENRLKELAANHLPDLRALESRIRSSIEFDKVVLGTAHAAEDKVMMLQGWIPADKEEAVKTFLSGEQVYYEIRQAVKGDNVPILLRNNALTRMYEVLTEMYGMPDYEEFDPTPLIAPFFTLFFGLCLGDAGYGLILVVLGLFLKGRMDKSMKGMMNLVITLGAATTVIGAVMGTFFGVSLFDLNLPDSIKQFMIVGKIDGTTYDKQMLLAILIGVFHLCFAMAVKAITCTVRFGFKESLSAWGWLLLIVGFVCTGGLSFFECISADTTFWSFIVIGGVSAIGIYLLNDIHRNPLLNVGAGLWDTYNMATGLLGDVLSYIRLYALGLAGGMLGGVFNMLAFMLRDAVPVPGLDWVCCGLVLVFGHTLNIAMSCLSAFVHPLRLTFLEYFKNSGYEGTGEAYKPFGAIEEK